MKNLFAAVLAIFRNQDLFTLEKMLSTPEVIGSDADYARVGLYTKSGLQQCVVSRFKEESEDNSGFMGPDDSFVVGSDEFFIVPVTESVIRQLGLVIESRGSEEEQRQLFGDELVDWINTVSAVVVVDEDDVF
jgi:hypothetical protein